MAAMTRDNRSAAMHTEPAKCASAVCASSETSFASIVDIALAVSIFVCAAVLVVRLGVLRITLLAILALVQLGIAVLLLGGSKYAERPLVTERVL